MRGLSHFLCLGEVGTFLSASRTVLSLLSCKDCHLHPNSPPSSSDPRGVALPQAGSYKNHKTESSRVLQNAVKNLSWCSGSSFPTRVWQLESTETLSARWPSGHQVDSRPCLKPSLPFMPMSNAHIFIFCMCHDLKSQEALITFPKRWSKDISCCKIKYLMKFSVKYMWRSVPSSLG